MKKLIAALAFLFIALAGFSQKRYYTSTDYGWQYQRFKLVKALGIPTGCGVPGNDNAGDSTVSAVFYDSCNAAFYVFNAKLKTWGQLSGSGGGITDGDKQDITVSGSGAVFTIKDSVVGWRNIDTSVTLQKILNRNNEASSDLTLHRSRGLIGLNGSSLAGMGFNLTDSINGSSAEMSVTPSGAVMRVHDGSATEGGAVVDGVRGRFYMGTPDDQLVMLLDSDTDRVSLTQRNGIIRGGGSLKLRFPITQNIWGSNYTFDLPLKSGTAALLSDIGDSLQKNNVTFEYNAAVGDSVAGFPNDSTYKVKNFIVGPGLQRYAVTDSTFGAQADSATYLTKAAGKKSIDSLVAVLSVGGGSQTPWTSHINAANYGVDSVGRYTGYRRTGTAGGSTENQILYSEQLDNVIWDAGSNVSVSATNVANDLEGNATLDALTCTFAGSNTFGQTITATPGDSLIVSFDAQLPGTGAVTNAFYQVYDNDHFGDIVLASYFSSLSTSVTRIKFGVLIPSGCNSVRVRVFGDGSSTGTIHIGRVHAGEAWANGYIETTGTAAPVSGGGGFTYVPTILFDSSGRIMLNAVDDSSLSLRTNSIDRLTINKDGGWLVNGSAGSTGQVLQSNGSTAAPTWVSLPTTAATLTTPRNISGVSFDGSADINVTETENAVVYKADFITAATGSNPPFTFTAVSSGTSAANITNINASHPGIIRLTSSTTANGGFRVYTDITGIQIGGGEEYVCIFAPVNFTTTTFRAGFFDATTSVDAADGIYFEYSTSGALMFKTASNSARTTSATLATLSLNTWYKIKLVVNSNATSATGYLYDAAGALLGSETITTTIPTGSARVTGSGIIATESTTTATGMVDIDYQHVKLKPVR